jgi:hypothetical protein
MTDRPAVVVHPPSDRNVTAALLFLGLAACYLTLSSGLIRGQGYTGEEIDSGIRMLQVFDAWRQGTDLPPMVWSRHGPMPVLLDLPFIALGHLSVSSEFGVSVQPILVTAAIVTVLYLWLRTLASPGVSLLLALTGAFSTMLWPYAYIGLETKQSFFLLLAGYLGLARGRLRRWPSVLLLGVAGGLAIALKANGIILGPAVLYLVYAQFREDWASRLRPAAVVVAVVGGIWLAGAAGRNLYWAPRGGGMSALQNWLIASPIEVFTNAIGILGSPTKGLFIFAPVLLAAIYAVPCAFQRHRETAVFALLVTGSTIAFLCVLKYPADEVWGSRYLHVAIAPLLVCVGVAWPRFAWRPHLSIIGLGIIGLPIAFLGSFYYYGNTTNAAKAAGQNTMEWLTGDRVWSEVLFDARAFAVWYRGGTTPVPWTPSHVWVWTPPPGERPLNPINIRDYSQPQSFMVRFWRLPVTGTSRVIFNVFQSALVIGPLLLVWVIGRTTRISRGAAAAARPSSPPGETAVKWR